MKTSIALFFILLSTSCSVLFAQLDSFSLQDYKFPDLKRTTLISNFDLNNNVEFSPVESSTPNQTKNSSLFNLNAGLDYTLLINSRKWQSSIGASTSQGIQWNRRRSVADSLTKFNNNAHSINLTADLRRYYNKNFFVEVNPDLATRFSRTLNEGNGSYRLSTNWTSKANVDLGVGKGRLEFVSDVHQAMFTIEDLQKSGRLAREVSAEDVRLVSDKIAALKNERFFDFRHKRIFQFTQLDSLLNDLGLIEKGDAATSAILYDNWLYAFRPLRFAGGRFSVGLTESLTWSKSKTITIEQDDYERNNFILGTYVEYRYERPTNLYWQHSAVMRLEWNRYRLNDVVAQTELNDYSFGRGVLRYTLSYYPNTRTEFNAGASFAANFNLNGTAVAPIDNISDELNYGGALFFDANYYVSPQFRVRGRYNFGYANRNAIPNVYLPDVPNLALDAGAFSFLDISLDYFFW